MSNAEINATPHTNPVIDQLFASGAHYGYNRSRRHPSVARFVFGNKGGIEIIDLEKTAECLQKASEFVAKLAAERKIVLFVGGKAEARRTIERVAERLGMPYVASRWIGGTFTNFSEIKKRLMRLGELSEMREKGELGKLTITKRERLMVDREITDLESMFGGLRGITQVPDAVIIVDPKHEHAAVEEAKKMNIPVVALLNTDCSAVGVAYPIPANDALVQSISYILDELASVYMKNLGAAPASPVTPVFVAPVQ